ncbi:Exported zinc metalloprotease YfgC precursor [hydrothermal vent metagenome]|uniref:Exported zinc metalloprotease YfgC n=1 Tax=hydrothermal vent metagenome TaxID=652676 RepID=A0A3B0YKN1_9ZZZZ
MKTRQPLAALFLILLLILPLLLRAELPVLGDPTQQELTPYREYMIGKNFYRSIKASVPFVEDLEVNDYFNNLGQKLASYSSQPDKTFHFFVIKVPSINAFAGPDAYIGFHTGLIIAAKNESELAGVMAHEISHVTQRHLARAMTESNTSPAAMFASILAGILLASKNPEAGAALIMGGQAVMMQSQINFTRANEHEADRIGIGVLRDAGINPEGMAGFFETLLQQSDRDNVFAQMEYLRTHPLSTTRIAEARDRILPVDRKLPDDSLDFQLARARTLIEMNQSPRQLIKQIENMDNKQRNLITDYTLGLAYISNDQASKAIPLFKRLHKKSPHPWIQLALVDAYYHNHDKAAALKLLKQLNSLYPGYLPVSIRYARVLIDLKKSQQAITLLNFQLRTQKQAVVYNTLAKAHYSRGETSLAMEATSYEYELEGYVRLAAQQVTNALQQPRLNKTTILRLESRKHELNRQISKEQNH